MNSEKGLLPVERFVKTLHVVRQEGGHLSYSWRRMFSASVDAAWVKKLADDPEGAERLEAFVSRFGRMQDTIADKLLPRWLQALAERPGTQIEVLNRAEQLDVVTSVSDWLEARTLRNRLVHEYMEDAEDFAEGLTLASRYSLMLMDTYNRVRDFALHRMDAEETTLPAALQLPGV
ncbi:MAG: hypothetical protein HYU75_17065 [Betaproteobacteria bacterium]|nr:hypothetical protein [Betaproteobacteria bacterium]